MNCDTSTPKLDAYLDGELAAADMSALDEHIRNCPKCAAQALSRVQMKLALKTAGKRFTPSPEFKARMLKTIQREQPAPARVSRWYLAWAFPAAALALLLVTVLITGLSDRRAQQQTLASELTDLHVATLASGTPVDVISTDRHTVKPWFQGKIPFTFNLPELGNSGFELLGGRVTYLDQTPGAHLIYRLRKHDISVFIFPERALPANLPANLPAENAFHLVTFTQSGLRYYVVGDTGAADLETLAALLRAAAAS
jgi:anti-sigma factor RsiW